jgi:integration host factor subunit beta
MTKGELVEKLAATLQLPQHQTATVVELFFQCSIDALRAGDKVELRGFGSFRRRPRRARLARNPHTGAPIHLPATQVPWLTAGKGLRALVNQPAPAPRAPAGVRRSRAV